MCNINRDIDRKTESLLLGLGINLISKVIEDSLSNNNLANSTDVLGTATTAYQQGKITKTQLMAVINALDEQTTYQTRAYAEPSWNQEYLDASKYLNQYRK